ncbi:MAG TPA: permease-like cell division protein FtsX [Mycobacteriales bacterium]|jgi:cell division transport system permease protein|nr:permease-like cell division protein FtsX [Mycobacteriales bacterium]
MRANFVLSEVWTGLRRNLTMTIAMVLTTAISLGLLGAGLLIAREISQTKQIYYDKIEVSVFLQDKATAAQKSAIVAKLKASPEVEAYSYETKAEAYKRFKKLFAEQQTLINQTPSGDLPASYRVKLKNPEHYPIIAREFPQGKAGVDVVQDDGSVLNKLFSLLNAMRNATIAVAIIQALAALLLISNTIQVAAFTRRAETGIMRLVGASRWYTQLPFILEAAFAGFIGAVLAVVGLGVGKKLFIEKTSLGDVIKSGILRPVDWNSIFVISPVLVAVGVLLASIAAYFTLRLYVRL